MKDAGMAHMGVGYASGKDKAETAATMAISSPLLETSITSAKAVIINVCASPDLLFDDAEYVSTMIEKAVHPNAAIFWGLIFDETMTDEIKVTVIATGFDEAYQGKDLLDNGKKGGSEPESSDAPAKNFDADFGFEEIMNIFNTK